MFHNVRHIFTLKSTFIFKIYFYSLTDAGVESIDVGDFEPQVTFTQVAPKRVHTLPTARTNTATRYTLINVCREKEGEKGEVETEGEMGEQRRKNRGREGGIGGGRDREIRGERWRQRGRDKGRDRGGGERQGRGERDSNRCERDGEGGRERERQEREKAMGKERERDGDRERERQGEGDGDRGFKSLY